MKRVLWLSAFFVVMTACAPVPVPTRTLYTPTSKPSSVATTVPKTIDTPTATAVATESIPVIPTTSPTITPVTYDRSPRAILVEADILPRDSSVPSDMHVLAFRLYGDGWVVLAGERAPISSGLDATVRVGHLADTEIQTLLASVTRADFNSLLDFYSMRSAPLDLPSARISIYLNKVKTVSVEALGYEGTPASFSTLLNQITQTIPADVQPFTPTDAYFETTDAGAVSNLNKDKANDWTMASVRLADAIDGVTVSGNSVSQMSALIAKNFPSMLYREGDRAYRVRFAPNLPRAVHLTDWLAPISDAPREFDGRVIEIVGYYRGWNLFGEARGNPPVTRNDWAIVDDSGAMYVTGAHPQGLDPSSRADAWSVVRLTAKVVYVRLGTSYLETKNVQVLSRSAPTPTPTITATIATTPTISATSTRVPVSPTITVTATRLVTPTMSLSTMSNADSAIAAIKARFPDMAKIQRTSTNVIGAATSITVLDRADGWDFVFREGSGDCMAGCINNRYFYFSVKKDGSVKQAGEYSRVYDANRNAYETSGSPMWDVPKQ